MGLRASAGHLQSYSSAQVPRQDGQSGLRKERLLQVCASEYLRSNEEVECVRLQLRLGHALERNHIAARMNDCVGASVGMVQNICDGCKPKTAQIKRVMV